MTPTGIEPVLPPWKGDVLTAWPRSLIFCPLPRKTPPVGLEPTTTRLTAECSTDWAKEDYPENTYWLYTFKTTYNSLWLPIISSFLFLSPIGYALDRLVTVSYMHYCTSTSVLSTSSSSRGLTTFVGISHLEGGFTLRCLQRLSRPGLATLPCSW